MPAILRVIADNLAGGRVTVRLPGRVPPPPGYRGRVRIDPSRCVACGVCAYVCVSDAITGETGAAAYAWTYDPARCTFCGRCVDRCPGVALRQEAEPLPACPRPGDLAERQVVTFPTCPECGTTSRPITEELVRRAFDTPNDDTRDRLRLCERCRRRRLQRSLVVSTFDAGREEVR